MCSVALSLSNSSLDRALLYRRTLSRRPEKKPIGLLSLLPAPMYKGNWLSATQARMSLSLDKISLPSTKSLIVELALFTTKAPWYHVRRYAPSGDAPQASMLWL